MNKPLPELSELALSLEPGKYKHFKGMLYEVYGVARNSETLEEMVIYQAQYGDYGFWVRPVKMFFEKVTLEDGQEVPRFSKINPSSEKS